MGPVVVAPPKRPRHRGSAEKGGRAPKREGPLLDQAARLSATADCNPGHGHASEGLKPQTPEEGRNCAFVMVFFGLFPL